MYIHRNGPTFTRFTQDPRGAVKNVPPRKIKVFAFLRSHKPIESPPWPARGCSASAKRKRTEREQPWGGRGGGGSFSRVVLTPVRSLLIFRVVQRREQCRSPPPPTPDERWGVSNVNLFQFRSTRGHGFATPAVAGIPGVMINGSGAY